MEAFTAVHCPSDMIHARIHTQTDRGCTLAHICGHIYVTPKLFWGGHPNSFAEIQMKNINNSDLDGVITQSHPNYFWQNYLPIQTKMNKQTNKHKKERKRHSV